LFKQYGVQNVLQAVTNVAAEYIQNELNALVDSMGMPQFMADDAKNQISNIGGSYTSDVPFSATEGVNKVLQQSPASTNSYADDIIAGVMNSVNQSIQDATTEASQGNGEKGGSGNWLAMAQIFKMFQEAISTMIKSIGEGMSSVARKQ